MVYKDHEEHEPNCKCKRCYKRAYYAKNKQKYLDYNKKWRDAKPDYKTYHNKLENEYYHQRKKLEPAYKNEYSSKRRQSLAQFRVVNGTTKALYAKAVLEGKTVDHIIPLRGEFVSGLHVPWNLTLLTDSENKSKGNKCDLENESKVQFELTKMWSII